ncbi:shufflon system plasmid conjugative transfer pilus tip adhesin PilV [Pseudomonas sp. NC26]|uniref:shufflon system plasmid conjugative transfer pilus tip adhesin PilV n=1 Tax=Pseudomonas sp. NC26 TaxID=3114535 RepID=UPI002DEC9D5F|nr:shufflon system plasmid conjugative transfer pilus tip adhesin PilV [Pseudomonas sp. NC26]
MRGSMGRQAGFSLLELTIVLAIMAMLAVAAVPRYMEEINRNRSRVTTENTQAILDAARAYRLSNGAWPGGASCINAISEMVSQSPAMLPPGLEVNKYNNAVSTSCTAWTFSVDQSIVEDWDGVLANNLPGTSIVNASQNRIRSTIGIPGSETANDAKLSRLAEQNVELNRMKTNLLLGNFDIKEVGRIEAVNATISGLAKAGRVEAVSAAISGLAQAGRVEAVSAAISGLAQAGRIEAVNAAITGLLQAGRVEAVNAAISGLAEVSQLRVNGESQFSGEGTFQDGISLQKVVQENTFCPKTGAIARTSTGAILSCQSGIWKASGSMLDGPYVLSANGSLGVWKLCTLGYTSGNTKQLTYSNGNWYADIDGTRLVYCYK